MAGKLTYRLVGMAFAIPTGYVIKKGLDAAWRRSRGSEPPRDPTAPDVTWSDALVWAAISGLGVAAGQLIANRGAGAAYRALTGREPPGLEEQKAQESTT